MGSHVHPATIPWKIITNIWANIKSRFLQKHLPLVIIKYPINNSKKTPSTMKNLLIFTVTPDPFMQLLANRKYGH